MIRNDDPKLLGKDSGDIVTEKSALDKSKKPEKQKGKTLASRRTSKQVPDSPVPAVASTSSSKNANGGPRGPNATVTTESESTENGQILTLLKDIQSRQMSQNVEMRKITQRVTDLENNNMYDDNQYDENYDENYDEIEPEQEPCLPEENNNIESGQKRKCEGKFASMTKRVKTRESFGPKIDETLAENLNELFRNGMNEDQFTEMVKDEITPRPENCLGLSTVKTNPLIWDFLSPQTQTIERKMQLIQKAVVKSSIIIAQTVHNLAELDVENPEIDKLNDALALLGHCNRKTNLTRRDLIKPEMSRDYVHLCSQSNEYTNFLFGDDISKKAKEIEDCSKISYKIQGGNRYNSYGANNSRYGLHQRGRGRGRRARGIRGARGYYRGGQRGQYMSGQTNYEAPKNPQKRGGFQNKDKN